MVHTEVVKNKCQKAKELGNSSVQQIVGSVIVVHMILASNATTVAAGTPARLELWDQDR